MFRMMEIVALAFLVIFISIIYLDIEIMKLRGKIRDLEKKLNRKVQLGVRNCKPFNIENHMLDKEKIEEAKEEIFDKEDFYLYSQEVENPNGKNEYLYTEQQIKDAIGLGISWAIEHFLNDLWHDSQEEPKLNKEILVDWRTENRGIMYLQTKLKNWKKLSAKCRHRFTFMTKLVSA